MLTHGNDRIYIYIHIAKSDLFEQAKIFAGTSTPKRNHTIPILANTSAIIFSYALGAGGLFL